MERGREGGGEGERRASEMDFKQLFITTVCGQLPLYECSPYKTIQLHLKIFTETRFKNTKPLPQPLILTITYSAALMRQRTETTI